MFTCHFQNFILCGQTKTLHHNVKHLIFICHIRLSVSNIDVIINNKIVAEPQSEKNNLGFTIFPET